MVVVVSVLLGLLLVPDPTLDPRVKLGGFAIQVFFTVVSPFYPGTSLFSLLQQVSVPLPAGLGEEDGIRTVDLVIPAAPESVFPGITPLVPVNVRMFYNDSITSLLLPPEAEKLPVIIYMHGGGYVLGSAVADPFEGIARRFVSRGNFLVVSVDYRLAPGTDPPPTHTRIEFEEEGGNPPRAEFGGVAGGLLVPLQGLCMKD